MNLVKVLFHYCIAPPTPRYLSWPNYSTSRACSRLEQDGTSRARPFRLAPLVQGVQILECIGKIFESTRLEKSTQSQLERLGKTALSLSLPLTQAGLERLWLEGAF